MYYRRKLLLSILQKLTKKEVSELSLQKTLFLVAQKQSEPCFDFVFYKGNYISFQAEKDIDTLSNYYKLVSHNKKKWRLKTNQDDYFYQLKGQDQKIITEVLKNYNKSTKELKEKKKIATDKNQVFSIGYEKCSIDYYLNLLMSKGIDLLCDVRRNALSMKYGFSKNQLSKFCEKLNIEYIHMPCLGIESNLRENLTTPEDYQRLFERYESSLKQKDKDLKEIEGFLKKFNSVAFTCFEKDHKYCHRNSLLEYYNKNIKKINLIHL